MSEDINIDKINIETPEADDTVSEADVIAPEADDLSAEVDKVTLDADDAETNTLVKRYVKKDKQAEPKVLSRSAQRKLDDKIQYEKTLITENEMEKADYLPDDCIEYVHKGSLERVRTKNNITIIAMVVLAILAFAGAAVLVFLKGADTGNARAYGAIACLLVVIFITALLFNRVRYVKDIKEAEQSDRVIFSLSLKKTPYLAKLGEVYELIVKKDCPRCASDSTEGAGEIHIERVEGELVAVCNYNRKHFFMIDEKELIKRVR